MSYGQDIPTTFLPEILSGALVAIVTAENSEDLHQALTTSLPTSASTISESSLSISHTPPPTRLPYIPSPPSSGYLRALDPRFTTCAALALVRAINPQTQELHLLTPLSEAQTASLGSKKVVLVRGGFDGVEWAYLEDLYAVDSEKKKEGGGGGEKGGKKEEEEEDVKARPWVARKEMVGIEGAVWRLRHPPTAAQVNGGR